MITTRFNQKLVRFNFITGVVIIDGTQYPFDDEELPDTIKGFITHYRRHHETIK